jgi:hypothetical protein
MIQAGSDTDESAAFHRISVKSADFCNPITTLQCFLLPFQTEREGAPTQQGTSTVVLLAGTYRRKLMRMRKRR